MEEAVREVKEELKNVEIKVESHTQDLIRLQESHKYIKQLADEVVKTNKALNETIQDIKITMVSLQSDVTDVKSEVRDIKTDFNKIKEERVFNIMEYVKKNFPMIVIGVILIGYIVANKFGNF